jgi:hypothetical protein
MIKKLLLIVTLGVTLSGCFMAPMALIGPVTSGYSTASILQSGFTTGANYMVKKSTGKTITEHALDGITRDILQNAYFPTTKNKIYSYKSSEIHLNIPNKNYTKFHHNF